MNDELANEEGTETQSDVELQWDALEIVSVVVLASVGVLILGGLVTGIASTSTNTPSLPSSFATQQLGFEIASGASWASFLLSIVLLAVMGLGWWQITAWNDGVAESAEDPTTSRHIGRAHRISQWALVGLGLTAAGSVAGFIGQILTTDNAHSSALSWSRDFVVGGEAVGVLLVAALGAWLLRATGET